MSRRRALMQMSQNKSDCVTQIISPCAFDSTGGRNSMDIIKATTEAGKTYRITYSITVNVTDTNGTTDFYVRGNYSTWHGYNKRQYRIGLGVTEITDMVDKVCYLTSSNYCVFSIDSTNVKGTVTVNSFTIVEV